MAQEKPFRASSGLLCAKQWEQLLRPALNPYNNSVSKQGRLDKSCVVPPAAEDSLRAVAVSLQKGTDGMSSWSIADLTLGLYKLARRHNREGAADTIDGCLVESIEELQEISHWLQWVLAAYSKDTQSLADSLKLKKHQIIRHVPTSAILKPAFYIAVDNIRKCVVMCIRGTQAATDVLTDLNLHGEQIEGGYAHAGMLAAARRFHDNEGHILRDLLVANQGYRLVLVGHSLGAGTAGLLCMLLRGTIRAGQHCVLTSEVARSNIICWGFGCPPCMDRRLAKQTSYIRNVVLQDDMVPRLCPAALEGLRSEILETDWNQALDDSSKTKRMIDLVRSTYSALGKIEPSLGLEKGYLYDHAKKYGHAVIVATQRGMVSSLVKAQHGGHGAIAQKVASFISLEVSSRSGVLPVSQDYRTGHAYASALEIAETAKDLLEMRRLIVPGIIYHILRKPLEHGDNLYSQYMEIRASKTHVRKDNNLEMNNRNIMFEKNQQESRNGNEAIKNVTDTISQYMVVRNDDPSSNFKRIILSSKSLSDHSLYTCRAAIVDATRLISDSTASFT
ncbi:hypothetical protein O6H91_11G105200 [Diphasiastrum complanatum]|uniref:Uncharacterized protein n=1 Tax=Diphasiastrum complanatum TaxID=34168 RepID=A0ACC2CCS8_DIPCM|nr:hypothetical protein O6H91_11G105200 [Diphasiastrum complanatum]